MIMLSPLSSLPFPSLMAHLRCCCHRDLLCRKKFKFFYVIFYSYFSAIYINRHGGGCHNKICTL